MEEWQQKIDTNMDDWHLLKCNGCKQELFWVYEKDDVQYFDSNGITLTQEKVDAMNYPAIDPHEISAVVDSIPVLCIKCHDQHKEDGKETWEWDK